MRPLRGARERADLSTETIAAVDWAVSGGLERDFAALSTLGAHSIVHLAAAAVSATRIVLAGTAAALAALGFVGKALL